jgi:hypothetical protein
MGKELEDRLLGRLPVVRQRETPMQLARSIHPRPMEGWGESAAGEDDRLHELIAAILAVIEEFVDG